MAKSEFAQAYTERMFPDIASPAGYIDPEFEDLFENFAFHEAITEDGCNVAAHSRFLAILATLVGAGATDEYSLMMPAALNFGNFKERTHLSDAKIRYRLINELYDFIGDNTKIYCGWHHQ